MKRFWHTGFTLIELVMVIILLGILAVVLTPRIGDFASSARTVKTKQLLYDFRNQIEEFKASSALSGANRNKGYYPGTVGIAPVLNPSVGAPPDLWALKSASINGGVTNPCNKSYIIATATNTAVRRAACTSGVCGWGYYATSTTTDASTAYEIWAANSIDTTTCSNTF